MKTDAIQMLQAALHHLSAEKLHRLQNSVNVITLLP